MKNISRGVSSKRRALVHSSANQRLKKRKSLGSLEYRKFHTNPKGVRPVGIRPMWAWDLAHLVWARSQHHQNAIKLQTSWDRKWRKISTDSRIGPSRISQVTIRQVSSQCLETSPSQIHSVPTNLSTFRCLRERYLWLSRQLHQFSIPSSSWQVARNQNLFLAMEETVRVDPARPASMTRLLLKLLVVPWLNPHPLISKPPLT